MELHEVMPKGINPKLTEQFLLSCPEVLDASVLWSDGALFAFVTVGEQEDITPIEIQGNCMDHIGLHQTPRVIKLMRAGTTRDVKHLAG